MVTNSYFYGTWGLLFAVSYYFLSFFHLLLKERANHKMVLRQEHSGSQICFARLNILLFCFELNLVGD